MNSFDVFFIKGFTVHEYKKILYKIWEIGKCKPQLIFLEINIRGVFRKRKGLQDEVKTNYAKFLMFFNRIKIWLFWSNITN